MLNLRRWLRDYEARARSLSDLIPWVACPAPDVVLCKDGGLLACFEFSGMDVEAPDPGEVDACAARLEHALRGFDERFVVWSTVHRRPWVPPDAGDFPDAMSARLEHDHLAHLRARPMFENRHYLSIFRRPPPRSERLISGAAARTRGGTRGRIDAALEGIAAAWSYERAWLRQAESLTGDLDRFREALDAFHGAAPAIGLRRLARSDLLVFLHDCCSPASAGQPVRAHPSPGLLDTTLCDNSVSVGSRVLRFDGIDRLYCAALTLRQWPDSTHPGLLDGVLSAAGEIVVSQAFRFVDREAAAKHILSVERFNLNLQKRWSSYVREAVAGEESAVRDGGRAIAAADAADALTEMTEANRSYGYLNFTALLYASGEEALHAHVKAVGARLRSAGFLVLRESFHLWPAWCGTLPGQWAAPVRWQFVSSANLADLCPVRTVHSGTATNDHLARQTGGTSRCLTVLETEYRVPYHFNFHHADLGHAMVIGPSRSGKSVFVNFLLSQFRRYHPANVFVFDKDRSCRIPTVLHGGVYVDPDDGTDALRVNPLARLSDASERDWVLGWLRRLLGVGGRRLDSADDRALRTALDDTAGLEPSLWRLRTLYGLLPAELRDELERWVGDNGDGRYFDNAHDTLSFADWRAIEIGGLMRRDGLAHAFMDYAMHRISRALDVAPPRPTAIYLEEAWFLLSHPEYVERVRDWLKTIPKRLGFVVMATQSLADIERSELFASVADNVPTRVFLPNRQADAFRAVYVERFGLRPAQVDRIRDAVPKRQYYAVSPLASRLVEVRFSPAMLAALRSDALAQTVFSRHRDAGGDGWIDAYLQEMANVE